MPGDPLTAKAVALGSTFSWLNHTWDHTDLDSADYATRSTSSRTTISTSAGWALMPYATANAVTPDISGLANADAMLAIHDAGITQIVSDTSQPGQNNPSPNAGILNALQPTVLEIPRIPSELYYNVSQPSEWIPEYEVASIADRRRRLRDDHRHPERRLPAVHAERQQRSLDVPSGEHARL